MNAPVAHLLIAPPSPALVQRLSPQDAAGYAIRAAMRHVCTETLTPYFSTSAQLQFDIIAKQDPAAFTEHTGSFRAWGDSDTNVQEGNYLPELIARYLCAEHGTVLGTQEEFPHLQANSLTMCMLNGSRGLTSRAPAMLQPGARAQHRAITNFLSGHSAELPDEVLEHPLLEDADYWQALRQLHPIRQQLLVADASLGVGRYFAYWQVAGV